MPQSWDAVRHSNNRVAWTEDEAVTERLNAATEERLKSGHAVGALSIV